MNRLIIFIAVVGILSGASTAMAASTADIVFIVDESGSMGGEHSWIAGMVSSLETALTNAGVTGNRYGLVGYGSRLHSGQNPHAHAVGGSLYGTAADLSTAAGTLVASGGTEDGYEAMQYALSTYGFRSDAAVNFILITDEDRDVAGGPSKAVITANLLSAGVVLNAVVNNPFSGDGGTGAIGVADDGTTYYTAAGGTFTETGGGTVGNGAGNTENDYPPVAFTTGGAGWDLNILRAGGNSAASFTAAFVDHKVEEIVTTPVVPLPAGAWMGLALLSGLGITRRLRRRR